MLVSMAYDTEFKGVHIYITAAATSAAAWHWWLDWESKTFWPVRLQANHEPMVVCARGSADLCRRGVILGGRNGYLRRYERTADDDDGSALVSYVFYGPIPLGPDDMRGILRTIRAVVAEGSGDITWNLYVAESFEDIWDATANQDVADSVWFYDETTGHGVNLPEDVLASGACMVLKLEGGGYDAWAIERISGVVGSAGKQLM